jgi:hypothetical protein
MADMTATSLSTGVLTPCGRCGAGAVPGSRFCSACGTPVASAAPAPLDVATRLSIRFAVLTIVANIVVGAAGFGIVYLVSGSPQLLSAALLLEGLHAVVVGSLVALTLRYGVRALRLSRDGRTRLSPWTVLSVVVAGLVGISVVGSLLAVAAMSAGML